MINRLSPQTYVADSQSRTFKKMIIDTILDNDKTREEWQLLVMPNPKLLRLYTMLIMKSKLPSKKYIGGSQSRTFKKMIIDTILDNNKTKKEWQLFVMPNPKLLRLYTIILQQKVESPYGFSSMKLRYF